MFRSTRLAWFVALLAIGVAVVFGVRFRDADRQLATLKESQRRMATYSQDMQSAAFARADATSVTYRVPQQVVVNGQTFVNTVERTARYGKVFEVFGAVFGDWQALRTVRDGAPIRILLRGTGQNALIEALYVLP